MGTVCLRLPRASWAKPVSTVFQLSMLRPPFQAISFTVTLLDSPLRSLSPKVTSREALLISVCLFVPRLSLWKNVPPKTAIREPGARPPFTQPRIDHSPSSGFKWSRNFRYASNPAAGRPILWPRDIGAWQTKSLARGIAFSSPMPSMSFPRLPFMSLPPRLEALTELKRDCGPIFSLMGLVSIVWNQPGAVFIAEASPLRARGHSGHCFPLKAAPFWPPSSS